jgi:hypothetical protein
MGIAEVKEQLHLRSIYSPDLKEELEPYENHLVFIWDNHKLSFPNERLLSTTKFLGEAWTVENNFVMRISPTLPIIYQVNPSDKEKGKVMEARVWGEVYALKTHEMLRLDANMDNTGSFIRRQRYVALVDQPFPGGNTERKVTVSAWIYLATPFFRNEVSDSLRIGSQTRKDGKLYWEWIKRNMQPTN